MERCNKLKLSWAEGWEVKRMPKSNFRDRFQSNIWSS